MTENMFRNELRYQMMLRICRDLHRSRVLGAADLQAAEELLNMKYRPVLRAA